jgi:ribosomal protein S18 acetylase RimI-like enzyme
MYRIREADERDAENIARIVNAAFEVERPVRGPVGNRTSPENVRDLMQAGDRFFVAERASDGSASSSEIVGAVFARITGSTGYFGMLAVDPSLQRSGLGRRLREHAERYCREHGCTEMTLSTGDFRTELLPYYERAGYRITSIEPGPAAWRLAKPFRIVHMAKPL